MTLTQSQEADATVSGNPVAAAVPRPEYPRPDRDRSERWLTLNGQWNFTAPGYEGTITVPFAWETESSGVGRVWLEQGTYRKALTAPVDWQGARLVLCFGAVHHHAVVSINGEVIGEHSGGNEYFEIDATDALAPGEPAELTVAVSAPADKRAIPHGKQRSIPRDDYDGVAFTPTSGIWQTVWLEARGRTYARKVALRGDSLTGIDVTVNLMGDQPAGTPVLATVLGTGEQVELLSDGAGRASGRVELTDPRLWSPDDPHLYRVQVSTGEGAGFDRVVATVGLRRFEARGEELFLNGERVYVRGVLDQGYWPESGLTAPDQDALHRDLELAASLGYNLVRKHLKFEEPLWLHEADRTGMLIWAEPPGPSRFSPQAAEAFEDQLPGMVERDGNHPSIVIWGLYNEEWGLDWDIPGSPARATAAERAYHRLRELDATRPIVENSGWSHVRTDLVDWHYYEPDLATWKSAVERMATGDLDHFPVQLAPDFTVDKCLYASPEVPRQGLPILNSEYGSGFTSVERGWHLRWETQELRRHDRLSGYVYTEFADVEHEAAGLLDAARRPKDWGGTVPAQVNADTVLVVDLVPLAAGSDIEPPHEPFAFQVHVSHHGKRAFTGTMHAAWALAGAPTDEPVPTAEVSSEPVGVQPFRLSAAAELVVPPSPCPARLLLWLTDAEGRVLARTFLDAAEVEPPNRRGARPGEFVDVPLPGLP